MQYISIENTRPHKARRRVVLPLVFFSSLVLLVPLVDLQLEELSHVLGVQMKSICPLLNLTGVPCPFCGLTRSFFTLLLGNISEAFEYHPLGPVFWGATALFGINAVAQLLFRWRLLVNIPPKAATAIVAFAAFILWFGNILYGHH